jgi:hypothetical protein
LRPQTRVRQSRSRPVAQEPKYAFDFLDETGTLGAARDPYFAVGVMHCDEPYQLLRPIQRMRDGHHFYDEIKWNKVSAKNLPILMDLVDVFMSSTATLHAFVADKSKHDGRVLGASTRSREPQRVALPVSERHPALFTRRVDVRGSRLQAARVQVSLPDGRVCACEQVGEGEPSEPAYPARLPPLARPLPGPRRRRARVRATKE